MALSVNGQILFVQTEGGVSVAVFRVENNGAMTLVDTAGTAIRRARYCRKIADAAIRVTELAGRQRAWGSASKTYAVRSSLRTGYPCEDSAPEESEREQSYRGEPVQRISCQHSD
jgi:hypothetical protein